MHLSCLQHLGARLWVALALTSVAVVSSCHSEPENREQAAAIIAKPSMTAQAPRPLIYLIAQPIVSWGENLEADARKIEESFLDKNRQPPLSQEIGRFIQQQGSVAKP